MTTTYTVSVGSFQGPFDLLLHLISRHKLDIYEVPLHQITDDYIAVIKEMEVLDLEVTTEFCVVAATLIELKAARMLPGEDDPELEELALEARDLLYARLLDYRTYKEAASYLHERLEAHCRYVPRVVPLEPAFAGLVPRTDVGVGPDDLAALAARAFADQPDQPIDVSHLQPTRMSVRQAASMLVSELQRAGGQASFAELTAGCRHPIEIIVCFLALLELYKLEQLDADQEDRNGSIHVAWNPEADWMGSAFGRLETYEPDDGATTAVPARASEHT